MAETTLPLFPLAAVLLPGTPLPLHIFEPRYRQLVTDLITDKVPGNFFGVVATRPGWSGEVRSVDEVRHVGCAALLREVKSLPDGRFDIITRGTERFRLLDIDERSAPYLTGIVEWLPDSTPQAKLLELQPALADSARAAHRRYCQAAWQREDWNEPPEDTDPDQLAHLVAADCLLDAEDRQRLLEQTCPARRLRMVRTMLNREAGILRALHAVPIPLSELNPKTSLN
ncbi:MAG TPA: LON peptidase substrate-binding domain-containing protein [Pseudonocardiaceae bacterium]|nr:LON peptidase substrate-binding domain-containing protein [Pseudonocardiaceae bacterium]